MNSSAERPVDYLKPLPARGALLGAALGLPLLALAQAGSALAGLPSPAVAAFEWVTHVLPGGLLTTAVEFMVGTLQRLRLGNTASIAGALEMGLAWLLYLGALGLAGAGYSLLARTAPGVRGGLAIGLDLWLVLFPLGLWATWGLAELLWVGALSLAWGVVVAWAYGRAEQPEAQTAPSGRRGFLIRFAAGMAAVTAGGLGLTWLFERRAGGALAQFEGEATPAPSGFQPVSGTRREVTPIPDFYQVDIKLDAPQLDAAAWRLALDGLVESPLQLSLADLQAMPAVDFYATLECISNNVGGDLISTALFSGVPLADLFARARLRPEAVDLKFTCADGYTESLPLASAADPASVLCYAMGGQPLAAAHGFPLRLFTPNRYGMKNPKWITRIEAVGEDYLGFWEKRGWSEAAWVKITSIIDAASTGPAGNVQAGGIAYAGSRGIQSVEVRLDEGEWRAAELKPALSGLTWVLWRAEVPAPTGDGTHRLTVRAVDGAGKVQIERKSEPHPDGASGHHSLTLSA